MCEEGAKEELCETCLERGLVRKADVVNDHLQMCRECFGGKPFRREEEVGGAHASMERRMEYGRRHRQRNLDRATAYQREWRRRNRERVNAYWRKWRKENQDGAKGESSGSSEASSADGLCQRD